MSRATAYQKAAAYAALVSVDASAAELLRQEMGPEEIRALATLLCRFIAADGRGPATVLAGLCLDLAQLGEAA